MIELLQTMPQEVVTFTLLVALIAVFYIAYKILSMVTQTIIIAILSGIFYVSLTYILTLPLTLENVLFFTVAGSVLYVGYTLLATTISLAKHAITIPVKIIELITYPIRKIGKIAKKKYKEIEKEKKNSKKTSKKSEENEKSGNTGENDDKDTKEVVIDKIAEEEEEN